VRLEVEPPDGITPASSVFSLASPDDEGLYGLGRRKDSFDQRGLLRNVWTEEQNASDERVEPVTCRDPRLRLHLPQRRAGRLPRAAVGARLARLDRLGRADRALAGRPRRQPARRRPLGASPRRG
jgi:hypothetical protein